MSFTLENISFVFENSIKAIFKQMTNIYDRDKFDSYLDNSGLNLVYEDRVKISEMVDEALKNEKKSDDYSSDPKLLKVDLKSGEKLVIEF